MRDADVLLERLEGRVADLPAGDRPGADRLLDRLRTQRCRGREQLLAALRSDRYAALLDRLVDVARVADMGAVAGDESHDADRAALRSVVEPAWKQLDHAVAALGEPPDDAALHRVRRRAKRARYAAEAVEPVFGKPARDFARGMADLQTVLGEHQDAVIAGRLAARHRRPRGRRAGRVRGRGARRRRSG